MNSFNLIANGQTRTSYPTPLMDFNRTVNIINTLIVEQQNYIFLNMMLDRKDITFHEREWKKDKDIQEMLKVVEDLKKVRARFNKIRMKDNRNKTKTIYSEVIDIPNLDKWMDVYYKNRERIDVMSVFTIK